MSTLISRPQTSSAAVSHSPFPRVNPKDLTSDEVIQSVLVNDPLELPAIRAMIARRQEFGGDRLDEVWEGVYFMAPMANDEHQFFVSRLATILDFLMGISGEADVRAGVNVSDREEDWEANFRVPDVAVFLKDTAAKNCDTFWLGGPDFLIEITSPYDQTHAKLPFYEAVGVREMLIVNRQRWQLELHRRDDGQLQEVAVATVQNKAILGCAVVPLTFQLVIGDERPQIEVKHMLNNEAQQTWLV